jgi:hypothetical protein
MRILLRTRTRRKPMSTVDKQTPVPDAVATFTEPTP